MASPFSLHRLKHEGGALHEFLFGVGTLVGVGEARHGQVVVIDAVSRRVVPEQRLRHLVPFSGAVAEPELVLDAHRVERGFVRLGLRDVRLPRGERVLGHENEIVEPLLRFPFERRGVELLEERNILLKLRLGVQAGRVGREVPVIEEVEVVVVEIPDELQLRRESVRRTE